jgi:hypothetical protein
MPDIDASLSAEIIDLLTDAEEYFDQMADCDTDDNGRPNPNTEMRLQVRCDDILNRLGVPCYWPRDKFAKVQ